MKKSFNIAVLVSAFVIGYFIPGVVASTTGYLYGHGLYIQSIPGTTVASISNAGAMVVTSLANSGALSAVGVVSTVGSVSVATSSTSGYTAGVYGAVVTLSTMPATVGQIWYQTSDNKIYVSTRVPAANVTYCGGTGCYAALN